MLYKFDKKYRLFSNILWLFKVGLTTIPSLIILGLIGQIIQSTAGLINSLVIGLVVDWVIKTTAENPDHIDYSYPIIIFGVYGIVRILGGLSINYSRNLRGFPFQYAIPSRMLAEKLNQFKIQTIENPVVQNVVTRYRENTYTLENMIGRTITISSEIVTLLFAAVPLFLLIPEVTILLFIAAIPDIMLNKHFIDALWKLDKDTTDLGRKGQNSMEWIRNPESMKEIKLLGTYKYLLEIFNEWFNKNFGGRVSIYRKWTTSDLISRISYLLVMILALTLIINFAVAGEISTGSIFFFITSIMSIGNTLSNISANVASFSGNSDRLNEMRALIDFDDSEGKTIDIEPFKNAPKIEIKDMSFAYPGSKKNVISNLNLTIEPGEKIAIVGENGAGKTTLVKLISNIYGATEGEILVNGENLKNISEASWFNNLGVLFQDFNKYEDLTAFENIALGRMPEDKDSIDYDEIIDAAKKADAHEFITEYENNYSQILSEKYEGGTRPSGGQWQKIAIARFFYRNAPLLILDEPTAAIDAVAEANIFNRIYKFIENKTVIIISHRFSTVRNADRILVFDKGKIVEDGSHEELMSKNGMYAKAFRLQAEGYQN